MQDFKQDTLDRSKRQTLQRLAAGAAFAAPLVTSVSVNGLTISKVHAATAASSSLRADDGKKDDHKKDGHKKKRRKKRCRTGEEWDPVKKQCAPREPQCPTGQVYVPEEGRCCDVIGDFVSCNSGTDQ